MFHNFLSLFACLFPGFVFPFHHVSRVDRVVRLGELCWISLLSNSRLVGSITIIVNLLLSGTLLSLDG